MHPAIPAAMVVAASTGGPNALPIFLAPIAKRTDAPILIVQHMPAAFTPVLAEKLEAAIGKRCREAVDGDVLTPGIVLLAPGDFHMRVARTPAGRVVTLDKGDPVNYCRPAADPLFETAAAAFGNRLLGIVLTGMGHDGRDGSGHIVRAGGRVIVQDESTSVVWGMPGAVAHAGFAEAVKPLKDLGPAALRMMTGEIA
jgi:two-component system chemotaxis response regulator CheB